MWRGLIMEPARGESFPSRQSRGSAAQVDETNHTWTINPSNHTQLQQTVDENAHTPWLMLVWRPTPHWIISGLSRAHGPCTAAPGGPHLQIRNPSRHVQLQRQTRTPRALVPSCAVVLIFPFRVWYITAIY